MLVGRKSLTNHTSVDQTHRIESMRTYRVILPFEERIKPLKSGKCLRLMPKQREMAGSSTLHLSQLLFNFTETKFKHSVNNIEAPALGLRIQCLLVKSGDQRWKVISPSAGLK